MDKHLYIFVSCLIQILAAQSVIQGYSIARNMLEND